MERQRRARKRGIGRPLVLLADDNGDTREMYGLYLGMVGYHVEVVADGREAVAMAGRLHPDVIVMDLDMPNVDGWAAMKQLHGDPATARIPIIILTGHDLKAYLKPAALAAGAVSYVMKPCFPEQLAHEISLRLAARLDHADAIAVGRSRLDEPHGSGVSPALDRSHRSRKARGL